MKVRLIAAQALGIDGDAQTAIPILAQIAEAQKDPDTQLRAIEIMFKLGQRDLSLAPTLVQIAQSEHEPHDRRLRAVQVLLKLGEHDVAIGILRDFANHWLSWLSQRKKEGYHYSPSEPFEQAIHLLGQTGATKTLKEIAVRTSDKKLLLSVYRELVQHGETEITVPGFVAIALSDPTQFGIEKNQVSDFWKDVLNLLAKLGKSAIPGLRTVLLKSQDNVLRQNATLALAQLGDNEGAKPNLLKLATNEPNLEVAKALAQLGDTEAAKMCLSKLATNEPNLEVAKTLAQLGDIEAAKTTLLKIVENPPKWYEWEELTTTVSQLDDRDFARKLLTRLAGRSMSAEARLVATKNLIELDPETALNTSEELATFADNEKIRQAARVLLGQIGVEKKGSSL